MKDKQKEGLGVDKKLNNLFFKVRDDIKSLGELFLKIAGVTLAMMLPLTFIVVMLAARVLICIGLGYLFAFVVGWFTSHPLVFSGIDLGLILGCAIFILSFAGGES